MPASDDDGLTAADLDGLGAVLARDPALRAELELILPALDPGARRAFRRTLSTAAAGRHPAAVVLEALAAATGAAPGRRRGGRA